VQAPGTAATGLLPHLSAIERVHSNDPKLNKEVIEQADENETEQISVLQHSRAGVVCVFSNSASR
jgi:hypothetical protein